MPLDVLDRLILDPGTRSLGELHQEREWAVREIRHLSLRILRMRQRGFASNLACASTSQRTKSGKVRSEVFSARYKNSSNRSNPRTRMCEAAARQNAEALRCEPTGPSKNISLGTASRTASEIFAASAASDSNSQINISYGLTREIAGSASRRDAWGSGHIGNWNSKPQGSPIGRH